MIVKTVWVDSLDAFVMVDSNKGNPHYIYPIQTKISKQYSGFRLILKDLTSIKEAINELRKTDYQGMHSIVKQSLSFYSVITYGKCFAQADERSTRLHKSQALKYVEAKAQIEHDIIIEQRNQYIAHASSIKYESNPIVASLNKDLENKKIIKIYDNILSLVDIDSQLENFDILIEGIIKYVKEKYTELMAKIDAELKEIPIEQLYKYAIDPIKLEGFEIKTKDKEGLF